MTMPLNISVPRQPDPGAPHTPRQADIAATRKAIESFCDKWPGAGEIVNRIGERGKDSLARHIVDELHPRAKNPYDPITALYDAPFGTSM